MSKRCLIDGCPNSLSNADQQVLYVTVPRDVSIKEKWLKVCRKPHIKMSTISSICELHFSPEQDFDNLRYLQMFKGSVKLVKGACPSKFPWNDWGVLQNVQVNSSPDDSTAMDCTPAAEENNSFSPFKRVRIDFENKIDKDLASLCRVIDVPTFRITDLIAADPQLYLGCSKSTLVTILSVCKKIDCVPRDVLIVLMYIRLHQTYKLIGNQFGISESAVSKNFYKTIIKLAASFIPFIYWPDPKIIKINLPVSFRLRYKNVQGIIDCFEISIQKPDSAVAQSRTWSQYKNCNTTKYLVNITPDGYISFVSQGFPGRISDSEVFKNCGIIEKIPDGAAIMVDRGFRNVGEFFTSKSVEIICPPSLHNKTLTREEVVATKMIASLRINVERIIGQMRNFALLKGPINNKLLDVMDSAVIIVAGLVNLQKKIIKD